VGLGLRGPVYSGGGMDTIHELAEKIRGLLDPFGAEVQGIGRSGTGRRGN